MKTFVLSVLIIGAGFTASAYAQVVPIPVKNCTELQNIGLNYMTVGGNYVLANDIDCSDSKNYNDKQGFNPIGVPYNSFRGTFDGNGHTISNLYIDGRFLNGYYPVGDHRANSPFAKGLFGYSVGTIKNVTLLDARVQGLSAVGAVVGLAVRASIVNVHVASSSVKGSLIMASEKATAANSIVGGIVGVAVAGTAIINSSVDANLSGPGTIGGLVGSNAGDLNNCTFSGVIASKQPTTFNTNVSTVGMLVGVSPASALSTPGIVQECYANGELYLGMGNRRNLTW